MPSATGHHYALHNVLTAIVETTSDEGGGGSVGVTSTEFMRTLCQPLMRIRATEKTKHWRCCRKKRHDDGRKLSLAQAARLLYARWTQASDVNAAEIADVPETTVED
ncbi:hypothetical protein GN244_ATG01367 [Phytophthora infestans]|uniref:Uncharacterized protein n=1 Tax=Phytophthora infestans TaxID=4787 RepID=A0A833T2A0_PHYIN|nr:hypothetical protein GN244_ATG01367 [Phytophthora infestans]